MPLQPAFLPSAVCLPPQGPSWWWTIFTLGISSWSHPFLAQVETRITCPLSAMQTFWYRRLLLKDSRMLAAIEAEQHNIEVRGI